MRMVFGKKASNKQQRLILSCRQPRQLLLDLIDRGLGFRDAGPDGT